MTSSEQIERARRLLVVPQDPVRPWGTLAATALMAVSAVALAGTIVLGPGIVDVSGLLSS